jgi:manganese transport system ATP-binding protein
LRELPLTVAVVPAGVYTDTKYQMTSRTPSPPPANPTTAPAIAVSGLSVRFGAIEALRDVSLSIPRGSLFGLLGPNGSGKSTLLKVLVGQVPPSDGRVEFGKGGMRNRSAVGYVPQASTADASFPVTVAEVVSMGLYGRRSRFRLPFRTPARVHEALADVSIHELRDRQVSELSGGQRRRVMIARALVREPDIVLLDEPAAGLDVGADEELTDLLRSLAGAGRTVVVATHDIEGVSRHYDDAALLAGRCIAAGTVADVLTDEHLHEAFGRQLLVFHGDPGEHHDVTFHQADHD